MPYTVNCDMNHILRVSPFTIKKVGKYGFCCKMLCSKDGYVIEEGRNVNIFANIVNGFYPKTIFAKILRHRCLTGP